MHFDTSKNRNEWHKLSETDISNKNPEPIRVSEAHVPQPNQVCHSNTSTDAITQQYVSFSCFMICSNLHLS